MPGNLLYSTNTWVKYWVQQRFRDDIHYVWCSANFDSTALGKNSPGAWTPPTSNPADIYKDLAEACRRNDGHNKKIAEQRASLTRLAVSWELAGEISREDKEEIIYMVKNAGFDQWKPLVYVFVRAMVKSRLERVPPEKRANPAEDEF